MSNTRMIRTLLTIRPTVLLFTLLWCWSAAVSADELYFVHTDHLGTPQVITDANQQTVWEGKQLPFGETDISTSQIEYNLRFPGQYYDQESGLHYNYFRDYDPSLGRYIQSDPIGLAGGINTYAYANHNPLVYTDPTGENPLALIILAIGLTVGSSNIANAPGICDETYAQNGLEDAGEAVAAASGLGLIVTANNIRKAANEARQAEKALEEARNAERAAENARKEIERLRQVEKELRAQLDNGRRQAAREAAEGHKSNQNGLLREVNELIPNEIKQVEQQIRDLSKLL